jgi:ferritin-like protein
MLSEPIVEDFQLVVDRIEKYDSHPESLVDVDDLSFCCKAPLIT